MKTDLIAAVDDMFSDFDDIHIFILSIMFRTILPISLRKLILMKRQPLPEYLQPLCRPCALIMAKLFLYYTDNTFIWGVVDASSTAFQINILAY